MKTKRTFITAAVLVVLATLITLEAFVLSEARGPRIKCRHLTPIAFRSAWSALRKARPFVSLCRTR